MKKNVRKTKIVATMGPACNSSETLSPLISEGVDVVRLNMSHSGHEAHKKNIATIRAVEKHLGRHVCILGDLKGPEIRTGLLKEKEITLEAGHLVTLTPDEHLGDTDRIQITHAQLSEDVEPGQLVYMSDGAITLYIEDIQGHDVMCRVQRGGSWARRRA